MFLLRRRAPFVTAVAAGVVLLSGTVRAQEPVMTNLELMTRLTNEVIEELITRMPAGPEDRSFILAPYTRNERYEFISNGFSRILTRRGHRVLTRADHAINDSSAVAGRSTRGMRLEYQALDFSLIYPKEYRSHLIGGKKVKRRANVALLVKLVDPRDESVVWIGEASRAHDDQFAAGLLPQVEAGLLEFTKPPHSSTRWGRVVEPVVVSGIIVGLIYLFFSNQNDN
ncbi:MAG: hypothetical protein V3V49_03760 [Candidatus Krumholzibacteria bacterium]